MTISNNEVTVQYSTTDTSAKEQKDDEPVPDDPSPGFSPLSAQSQVGYLSSSLKLGK
jgi:hypothetical protein